MFGAGDRRVADRSRARNTRWERWLGHRSMIVSGRPQGWAQTSSPQGASSNHACTERSTAMP